MYSSCHSSFLSWKLRKAYNYQRLKAQRIVTFSIQTPTEV